MRILRRMALAGLLLVLAASAGQAGIGWSLGINVGGPCYPRHHYYGYYRPYPIFVAPPPVYLAPAPVLVQPAPLYQPAHYVAPATEPAPVAAPAPAPAATLSAPAPASPEIHQYLKQLHNGDDRLRGEAIVQLGRLKATEAIEPLVQALNSDRSPTVREAAARGLGLIGSPDSLTALQQAAQSDDDREVRHSARFAADAIRGRLAPR